MALDYPNPIHWDEEFARLPSTAALSRRNRSRLRLTMDMACSPPVLAGFLIRI